MRPRSVVAALSLAVALAAAAAAHSANGGPPPPTAAQRQALERALTLVGDERRYGMRIQIAAPRPDVRAQIDLRERTITVFLDSRDAPHRVAHDLAHELGHAYDRLHLTATGRAAYLRARGAAGARWWPGDRVDDYAAGAGDFAEVYAACHAASPEFRSRLAPAPGDPCRALPPGAQAERPR